jgi:hypothetical protein
MSKARPRTGQDKPRTKQRVKRGNEWRDARKKLSNHEEDAESQTVAAKSDDIGNWNDVAKTLGKLADVYKCKSFVDALRDMEIHGLLGRDLHKKIREFEGVKIREVEDPNRGPSKPIIIFTVAKLKWQHPEWSEASIFEETALRLKLKSTSIEGAAQRVKRTWNIRDGGQDLSQLLYGIKRECVAAFKRLSDPTRLDSDTASPSDADRRPLAAIERSKSVQRP